MPESFRHILLRLSKRESLARSQSVTAFEHLMSGQASDAEIAGLLVGLAVKGVTLDELVGAADAMRSRVVPIVCDAASEVILDTCGTGGDVKGTFNISTAAAIVAAAAGVKIVKHGNRSASGNSGSADVLEQLGVNLNLSSLQMANCLAKTNLCFAFARNHHPAMKHVAAVRTSLGIPTIFNLLGPLTNPARARFQLLGVFAAQWTEPMAMALKELGSTRAWVVHADDGLDELSTMCPTRISELRDGHVNTWSFDPSTLGFPSPGLAALQVSNVTEAADAIRAVVAGQPGPMRDITLLNAGAALVVAGVVDSISDGLQKCGEMIDTGRAKQTLDNLVLLSQTEADQAGR